MPFLPFQESHFAFPLKSNKPNGRSVLQSPTVACLYKPYNSSISKSVGLDFSLVTSDAAFSNFSTKDIVAMKLRTKLSLALREFPQTLNYN
ncbi:hypothetical protein X975_03383, partial [Stegodyphus mimosarum]